MIDVKERHMKFRYAFYYQQNIEKQVISYLYTGVYIPAHNLLIHHLRLYFHQRSHEPGQRSMLHESPSTKKEQYRCGPPT